MDRIRLQRDNENEEEGANITNTIPNGLFNNASSSGDSMENVAYESSDEDIADDDDVYAIEYDPDTSFEEAGEESVISAVLESELRCLMRRGGGDPSGEIDVESIRRGILNTGGVDNPRNLIVGVMYYMLPYSEPSNYLNSRLNGPEHLFREMLATQFNIDPFHVDTNRSDTTPPPPNVQQAQNDTFTEDALSDYSVDSDEPLDYSIRGKYFRR